MVSQYTPSPGDLVWLEFSPQEGHEQAGRRPALVISHRDYNRKTGFALFCPITSHAKGYPFEVPVSGKSTNGVILSDQVKSLDWRARRARLIEKSRAGILAEVLSKLSTLVEF